MKEKTSPKTTTGEELRSQNVTLKRGQHIKYLPYAFTEHGILMLSSVLNSERADKINMLIIDTFVKLREILFIHKDVVHQLEKVQSKLGELGNQIMVILEYLKQFEQAKQLESEQKNRPRIGFNLPKKNNPVKIPIRKRNVFDKDL